MPMMLDKINTNMKKKYKAALLHFHTPLLNQCVKTARGHSHVICGYWKRDCDGSEIDRSDDMLATLIKVMVYPVWVHKTLYIIDSKCEFHVHNLTSYTVAPMKVMTPRQEYYDTALKFNSHVFKLVEGEKHLAELVDGTNG